MDSVNIVGKRPVSFTAEDGHQINGVTVYITRPDSRVEGLVADKLFISTARLSELSAPCKVGTSVLVEYNRAGKVADFHPVPSK